MSGPGCRRCLIKDLSDEEYARNIYDYIASLSGEEKVSDDIYAYRLSLCRECVSLVNGMCALCGCFAEVRAAKKRSRCPRSRDIWGEV